MDTGDWAEGWVLGPVKLVLYLLVQAMVPVLLIPQVVGLIYAQSTLAQAVGLSPYFAVAFADAAFEVSFVSWLIRTLEDYRKGKRPRKTLSETVSGFTPWAR